jgi:hypothetical protein
MISMLALSQLANTTAAVKLRTTQLDNVLADLPVWWQRWHRRVNAPQIQFGW